MESVKRIPGAQLLYKHPKLIAIPILIKIVLLYLSMQSNSLQYIGLALLSVYYSLEHAQQLDTYRSAQAAPIMNRLAAQMICEEVFKEGIPQELKLKLDTILS